MRIFHLLLLVLIANLFLFTKASDASQLSNDQKKEVVYKKYSDYKKEFPAVKEISPQQAMELFIQGELLFVDARKPAEMEVSMLPGAISSEIFLADPEKYKDKTIVIYCTISKRSGLLARKISRKGITVTNLKGGLLAWLLEGGKVYDEIGAEVLRAHVFGDEWDLAPTGYITVKFSLLEKFFL